MQYTIKLVNGDTEKPLHDNYEVYFNTYGVVIEARHTSWVKTIPWSRVAEVISE